jgi:peptidoglycan/xylan/chitin deacetylase (PgdA/CDA1 family)
MLRASVIFVFLSLAKFAGTQESGPIVNKARPAKLIEPKLTISSVPVAGPYIALTFDDGPHEKLTPRLLDLLAKHRIHATFFVIGENAAKYPEILQRAAREGHEIANHSWSHPNLSRLSDEAMRDQIERTEETIRDAIGARPTLLRPPYGAMTAHQKRTVHDELGYEIILWDVDPLDWKRPGSAVVTNRIVRETRPGSIVLAHDIHAPTIEAMPDTLNQLEARGFKFVTVSELLRMAQAMPLKPTSAPSPTNAPSLAPPSPNG